MEQRDYFISYTKKDEEWAVWVADTLVRHGFTVYVQAWDSPHGNSFVRWINDAIESSKSFIAIWSRAYAESGHCQGEIETEYNLKVAGNKEIFLPARVEDYPIKPLYRRFGRLDLFDLTEQQAAEQLLEAVRFSGKVRQKSRFPNRPVVHTVKPEDVEAIFKLGEIYQYGEKVKIDYQLALSYYQRAAELGNAEALNELGYLYVRGQGVDVDYEKAQTYYEQAAEKGNTMALHNLGCMYENGDGVVQDYKTALDYYQKVLDLGHQEEAVDIARLRKKMNTP